MKFLTSLFLFSLLVVTSATELSEIPFKTIDDKDSSLGAYKGKVVLVVNTASKCGLTGQYEGLEKLYKDNKGKGLVVIAFPCNDFAGQEPGSAEEIAAFCKADYGVSFPLMAKVHVKGKDQHPLYAALTGEAGAFPGDVKWNFGKFLIGKDGKPIARFEPKQKPESPDVTAAIAKALAE